MKNRYLFLSLLACLFSTCINAQQNAPDAGGELFVSGNDANNPCLTPLEYEIITARCAYNLQLIAPNADTVANKTENMVTLLNWPLKAASGFPYCSYYGITAHVDHDPTSGFIDYHCGNIVYNGHGGTDIAMWPYPLYMMDSSYVEVIAAAAGTIIDKADGNFDRNCGANNLQANYVVIQHADGSRVLYFHMKNGSITTKAIGQPVIQGEYLGVVGSSGNSSGPHLHFEVWAGSTNATRVDPFQGACNAINTASWWADQKPYREPAVIAAGPHPLQPVFPGCPVTEIPNESSCFAAGASTYFITFFRNETIGMVADLSIKNPDGTVYLAWTRTSSNDYKLSWISSTKTLPANVAGTFSFEVTYNGTSCSSSFDIAYAKITPASSTSICPGSAVVLNANAGIGLSYQWQRDGVNVGTNSSAYSAGTAGTYTAIVTTAHGCSATSTPVMVTLANAPSTSISGNLNICAGSSTMLNAGSGFTAYTWNTGANTMSINAAQAGTYTVTVTNALTCTGSVTATVTVIPLPQPSISGNLSICAGNTATLNAPAGFAAYAWNTGANTISINAAQAGTYTVTVTNALTCTGTATATVTVNSLPSPAISGNFSICAGSSALLDAGSGSPAYAWSTGANTQTIATAQAGTYTVTVTSAQGCTNTAEATVTVNPFLLPAISGNLSICAGDSTALDAGSGFSTYTWSSGANTAGITTAQAGTYTVTVTNAQGCTGTATATVTVNPLPTVNLGNDILLPQGQQTVLNAGTAGLNYLWSTGATTPAITVTAPGLYSVTVSDNAGCTATDEVLVTIITATATADESDQILVRPNPAQGKIYVSCANSSSSALQVINNLGSVVYEDKVFFPAGSTRVVNLDQVAAGIYYLQLVCEGKVRTVSIVML